MLAVIAVTLLAQAPGVWVTSTVRQGVSTSSAGELTTVVAHSLQRFPAVQGPSELTSCKRKLPCLVSAAKKAKAGWLVAVEAARVVDQVIVKVTLLSIEEDGRTVATAVVEGTEEQVRSSLAATVASKLGPPLERAFPSATPPVAIVSPPVETKPAPVPPPVPPPPPPPVAATPTTVSTVTPEPPPSTLRMVGLVTGITGLTALMAAGVLGGITLDAVAKRDARCPPGAQCNDPTALALHDQAALTQDLGVFLGLGGGAALATGVVLFILGAPSQGPTVSFVPAPGGAGVTLSSSF